MRRYLLDTGPLGAYLQGRPPIVELVTPWLREREASTSIMAYAEVVEYIKSFLTFKPSMVNFEGCYAKFTLTF